MGLDQQGRYCRTCAEPRLHQRRRFNHLLHLVLTVITSGLWGIVWILLVQSHDGKNPYRCAVCGTANSAGARPRASASSAIADAPGSGAAST